MTWHLPLPFLFSASSQTWPQVGHTSLLDHWSIWRVRTLHSISVVSYQLQLRIDNLFSNTIKRYNSVCVRVKFGDGGTSGQGAGNQCIINLVLWYPLLLQDSIHQEFDIDWYRVRMRYQMLVALYLTGIGLLFYYLIDNMFANNKLTPRRIKIW